MYCNNAICEMVSIDYFCQSAVISCHDYFACYLESLYMTCNLYIGEAVSNFKTASGSLNTYNVILEG